MGWDMVAERKVTARFRLVKVSGEKWAESRYKIG